MSEIQAVSRNVSAVWRHCPGLQNPADLVSRGTSLKIAHRFGSSDFMDKNERDWPCSTAEMAIDNAKKERSGNVDLSTALKQK